MSLSHRNILFISLIWDRIAIASENLGDMGIDQPQELGPLPALPPFPRGFIEKNRSDKVAKWPWYLAKVC